MPDSNASNRPLTITAYMHSPVCTYVHVRSPISDVRVGWKEALRITVKTQKMNHICRAPRTFYGKPLGRPALYITPKTP